MAIPHLSEFANAAVESSATLVVRGGIDLPCSVMEFTFLLLKIHRGVHRLNNLAHAWRGLCSVFVSTMRTDAYRRADSTMAAQFVGGSSNQGD